MVPSAGRIGVNDRVTVLDAIQNERVEMRAQMENAQLIQRFGSGFDALRIAAFFLTFALAFAGCRVEKPAASETVADAKVSPAQTPVKAESAPSMPSIATGSTAANPSRTVALDVLEVFTSTSGGSWDDYGTIDGVTWNEPAPVAGEGRYDPPDAKTRSGRFSWSASEGRTEAGSVAEQDATAAIDDKVGLSLFGRDTVDSVAFRRFRIHADYEVSLRSQLGSQAVLKLIADRCVRNFKSRASNNRDNAFFELKLGMSAPIYIEVYVDRDVGNSGPGYTTYQFTRDKPMNRIQDMSCIVS